MIDLKIGMRGRYKLAVKKNGETVRETDWFDNLITNQGMDLITTSTATLDFCQVGSSSVAPAFSDVVLGSRIAGVQSVNYTTTLDASNRYTIISNTYTFPSGAAAGNIAEVGVGTAATGNVLFSRALVLDSMSNPTTITVLPDEDLVVIYQLWIKQPTEDFISMVGDKTLTIRACAVSAIPSEPTSIPGWVANAGAALRFVARPVLRAYTGPIGLITASPTGTLAVTTSVAHDAYAPGSSTRVSRITWGTSLANFAILSFSWGFGPTYWQAQLSSPVTKSNTQTLRLGVRLTWSRDNGPA